MYYLLYVCLLNKCTHDTFKECSNTYFKITSFFFLSFLTKFRGTAAVLGFTFGNS